MEKQRKVRKIKICHINRIIYMESIVLENQKKSALQIKIRALLTIIHILIYEYT